MSIKLPPPNYDQKAVASRISAYRQAAEILVTEIEARGGAEKTGSEEPLLFPTVHVHRHYLELLLKALVEDAGVNWPQGHDLTPLWQRIRDAAYDEDIQTQGDCDMLFELLDHLHFADRYSHDRKSGKPYPKTIESLTLQGFRNLFVPVASHLEFCARLWLALHIRRNA
ncbi:MAG: hypothetical protein ACRD1B_04585 [Thermoanaerobaculia bacterium]